MNKKKLIIIGLVLSAAAAGIWYYMKKKKTDVVDSDVDQMNTDLQKAETIKKTNPINSGTIKSINPDALNWKAGDSLVASKDGKGLLIVLITWEQYKKGDAIGTFRMVAPDPNVKNKYWVLYTNKGGRYAQIELPYAKK